MSTHMPSVKSGIFAPLRWQISLRPSLSAWRNLLSSSGLSYLTNQYLVHENLIQVFFSNATLEQAGEHDQDPCCIMAINTFVMSVLIRVAQGDMATTFDMPNSGHSDEHEGFRRACSSPMTMLWTSHYMIGSCICSYLISSSPQGRSTSRCTKLTTGSCTMSRSTTRLTCQP